MTNRSKPNVVYIVLDDVGFSDLGCYGSEIKTPHMDWLASRGVRYNNFCATAVCSPTRACLLTGRNHHSVGMGHVANCDLGPNFPHTRGRINPAAATIAEILREHQYSTFAVGKWHLAPSHTSTASGPFEHWPLGKGFDRFYGFLEGATDQYVPELICDNHKIDPPVRDNYHLSEDITDQAIQFIIDQKSIYPEKPFFLNFAFGAQHAPHQVSRQYIDRYRGVYDKGWDAIRVDRFERQKRLGIIPDHAELVVRNSGIKPWTSLTDDERTLFVRYQETYAGFLTHTDEQIGRFINFLQKIDQLDNTIIVLMSDNGGSQEGGFNGSMNHSTHHNNMEEESIQDQLSRIDEIGGPYASANYPKGWAQVSNTPFQQYKQNTHFGGIRVPIIFHWPQQIKNGGAIHTQFQHVIDVTPTVLDWLHIEAPKQFQGIAQIPMHGTSIAGHFMDEPILTERKTQYFLTKGHRAIWHDGWKAVTKHPKGKPFQEDNWELYDTKSDFSEAHNVADQFPNKVRELQELWWEEAGTYGVLPLTDLTADSHGHTSPESPAARNHFTFYPGMAHLGSAAAPRVINRSYTITVPIECLDHSTEGVLVCHGNHNSGYTLYMMNRRLVYEYNYVGTVYRIVSNIEVPIGPVLVQFVFKKTGHLEGIGNLYINDTLVGEAHMPRTMPMRLSHEGLDVGRDSLSAVSKQYRDKNFYPFTGKIEKVVFQLQND